MCFQTANALGRVVWTLVNRSKARTFTMQKRFEVVSAPVETRMQEGLKEQAFSAIESAKEMFDTIDGHRGGMMNNTRRLLANDEFVTHVVGTGVKLAMPSSLPGFLFLFAVLMQLFHFLTLRYVAARAVAKHNIFVENEKKE